MNFFSLLSTECLMLMFLVIGVVLRRLGIADDLFTKKTSVLVAKVAQPFLIIYSVVKLEYSAESLKNGAIVFGFSILAHGFSAAVAALLFMKCSDRDDRKIHEYAAVFSNCGFLGLPLLNALFGEAGLFFGTFYMVAFNLAVWSYGILLMTRGKGSHFSLKRMLINVGTISSAIGIGIYIARLPLPDFLISTLSGMAGLGTPLSLIVTGALTAALPPKRLLGCPKLYFFCAVKLIFLPLLAAVILRLCGVSSLVSDLNLSLLLTVMIALPPAAFTSSFAEMFEVKPSYAAQVVCISTVLSPITIPLVVKLSQFIL